MVLKYQLHNVLLVINNKKEKLEIAIEGISLYLIKKGKIINKENKEIEEII